MRRLSTLLVMFMACGMLLAVWAPTQSQGKEIQINLISYTPSNTWNYKTFDSVWVQKVNKKAAGQAVVNFRGGPEIMGIFDMPKAVSQGSIDMAFTAAGFYGRLVPGCDVFRIPPGMGPTQWRKDGTFEYMQKLHNEKGLQFIGWLPCPKDSYYFWIASRIPIRNRNELKNKRFACSPPGVPFFKKLGAVPIVTPVPEFYSAVERGVADGNWMGIDTFISSSHYEVAPYVIDAPFSNATLCIIMNLKKWNSLSDDLKKTVMDVQLEAEKVFPEMYGEMEDEIRAQAPKVGAEFVKWSPEDTKWIRDMYAESTYADYEKLYGKEIVDHYKEMWGVK